LVSQSDTEREETTAAHGLVPDQNNKDRNQKQIEETNRGLGVKPPPPSNPKMIYFYLKIWRLQNRFKDLVIIKKINYIV
jgi:hypothetical protein